MAISVTTTKLVREGIGATLDPGDGITDVDYQRTNIEGNWYNHQIWVNYVRNDKTKLLKNLYRNYELYHIIVIFSGLAYNSSDPFSCVATLASLSATRNTLIGARLSTDPHFSNLVRKSEIEAVVTDGGFYASDSANPKAMGIFQFKIEYYTRD